MFEKNLNSSVSSLGLGLLVNVYLHKLMSTKLKVYTRLACQLSSPASATNMHDIGNNIHVGQITSSGK